MDFGRRKTQKYTFKSPKLDELRKLVSLVVDPEKFKSKYGDLLYLLRINMKDEILATLVQFYDPLYHCFTFPDYQLVPTLEEYSYWMGLHVKDKVIFSGTEEDPSVKAISHALYLNESDLKGKLVNKGGILGINAKFLMEKASTLASVRNMVSFEAILALFIYGLALFPNMEGVVDVHAIQIFLIGNPVPTLLGDAYHSIHHRTSKGGGEIVCCAPLLYKWFISHLPKSPAFWDLKDGLLWSQKIMSLTHSDIDWYDRVHDGVMIDSCGSFPNVPLLGTKGDISYNPVLARRQLGFPLKDKPRSIDVDGFFFK